jgi:hypothetical protein
MRDAFATAVVESRRLTRKMGKLAADQFEEIKGALKNLPD